MAVVRTGRSFRVILDSESGDVFATNPLDRLIVQVDVRDLDALRQRVRLQSEAVILRSDFDSASVAMQDRLIGSAMSELHFVNLGGERESKQLMSETNPEDRFLTEQTANRVDRVIERPRIARAV